MDLLLFSNFLSAKKCYQYDLQHLFIYLFCFGPVGKDAGAKRGLFAFDIRISNI